MANIIDPRIGTEYEGYILEELLGAGGMGAVYRARHKVVGNLTAIKIVTLPTFIHDKSLQRRFVREATALWNLKGVPHIAEIQHVKYDPEDPTDSGLVIEYIEGMSFDRYISQEAADNVFTRRQNLSVITKIAGTLARVHEKEVIHRDLKPENIMIVEVTTGDGKIELHPKLIDFGICQGAQNEGEEKLTSADNPFGSPLWAAPELFESADAVDHTVDIFSMGLMIYQILNEKDGMHFYGEAAYAKMTGHMRMNQAIALVQDKSRTKKILKNIPSKAAKIVRKCVAYNPKERMQTAKELEEACIKLDALLEKEEKEAIARGEQPPTPKERSKPASTPVSQTQPFGSRALTVPGPAAVTRKSAETVPATLADDTPEASSAKLEKRSWTRKKLIPLLVLASLPFAAAGIKLYIGKNGPSVSTKPRKAKAETLKPSREPGMLAKAKVTAPKPRPAPIKPRPAPKQPVLPKPPARGKRPSNAYIARVYQKIDAKCRRTDPRKEVFDRFPHYHLGCIRWYAQKLRDKDRKDFDRVALAVLILDEGRAHFCFYKRRHVCGKGKNKKFSARRPSLINECKKAAYKIGAKRKTKSSKLKRLTDMMSGPQAEKIGIWVLLREARRKQIRTAWIKSQPPDRMLCFKKRR